MNQYFSPPVNLKGEIVKRKKHDYPYSYDPFLVYRSDNISEIKNVIYSDRILQWDYKLTRQLQKKHFGRETDYYSGLDPKKIQEFLKERFGKKELQLVAIEEGCNISNGYPYWIFYVKEAHQ